MTHGAIVGLIVGSSGMGGTSGHCGQVGFGVGGLGMGGTGQSGQEMASA